MYRLPSYLFSSVKRSALYQTQVALQQSQQIAASSQHKPFKFGQLSNPWSLYHSSAHFHHQHLHTTTNNLHLTPIHYSPSTTHQTNPPLSFDEEHEDTTTHTSSTAGSQSSFYDSFTKFWKYAFYVAAPIAFSLHSWLSMQQHYEEQQYAAHCEQAKQKTNNNNVVQLTANTKNNTTTNTTTTTTTTTCCKDEAGIWNQLAATPPANISCTGWEHDWDGLGTVPPVLDPQTGRPLHVYRHLIFIRHGQYVIPSQQDSLNNVDPVLTSLGREQAVLAGQRLKELGYDISTIHASTMNRARETAELIHSFFPQAQFITTDLLREGVPCEHYPAHPTWKPTPEEYATEPQRISTAFQTIVKRYIEVNGQQVHDDAFKQKHVSEIIQHNNAVLETLHRREQLLLQETEKQQQTSQIVFQPENNKQQQLTSSSKGTISTNTTVTTTNNANLPPLRVDRYELVVCHGNVIRYALLRALQLCPTAWLRFAIYNTGLSHVTIAPNGNVSVRSIGDTGHLPPNMITYF